GLDRAAGNVVLGVSEGCFDSSRHNNSWRQTKNKGKRKKAKGKNAGNHDKLKTIQPRYFAWRKRQLRRECALVRRLLFEALRRDFQKRSPTQRVNGANISSREPLSERFHFYK